MKDFFISYNSADRIWAEWIAWRLEENGFETIIQIWDFRPGSNFVLEMQQASQAAARTIAVLSPDYLAASFTQPEWAATLAQDPTGIKGKLLPVRVQACELTGLLSQIVYIDLVGLDAGAAQAALLAGVQRTRAKPPVVPQFPGSEISVRLAAPRVLGAQPLIWNLPRQPNPNFTGRSEQFAELQHALTSGSSGVCKVAIHGLGGVGKTQLVTAYTYRHQADYQLIWWLRADTPTTLAADYAALAHPLQLPEKNEVEQLAIVAAVRRWLEQNQHWLLIFDNATGPEAVQNYWPALGEGHILITSRNPNWRGAATPLLLRVFSSVEAVDFLQNRTGQTDAPSAAVLAAALGELPLALEQAAAYMEETARGFADYLQLFQTRQRTLLQRAVSIVDYPATVATTWELAIEEVAALSPAAVELLQLCAYLAPDNIPVNLLQAGGKRFPPALAAAVADPLAWDTAVAALRRYSLLSISSAKLSVHRLVQFVVRNRLEVVAQGVWATAAVQLVNDAFPEESADVRTWPVCANLLPHAETAVRHAELLTIALEAAGRLLNQVGLYAYGRAAYIEAKAAYERALTIDETAFGPTHPTVAIPLNNLGIVLKDLGDLTSAQKAIERALAIDEAAFGPTHPTVATDINNLGLVLKDLGDLTSAKAAYERALAINEEAFGPTHPTIARDVNNLGMVLKDLGDLTGARTAIERALAIDEAIFGPTHPTVARDVNDLGLVLKDLGDLASAKTAYARALAIDEAAFGPTHPRVAIDVNNLGMVLKDLGDLANAKAAIERALAISEATSGYTIPQTAIYVNNLGLILQEMNDLAGAKAAYERAYQILSQLLGDDHPTSRTVRNNLLNIQKQLP